LAGYQTRDSILFSIQLFGNLTAGLAFDISFNRNTVSDVVIANSGSVETICEFRQQHPGGFRGAVRAGGADRSGGWSGAAGGAGGGRLEGEGQREQAQSDELPEELQRREQRLRKIQEAKARLEARQAEEDRKKGRSEDDDRKSPRGGRRYARDFGVPPDKTQENFTDPESRIMKTTHSFEQ
jgi:hypothetical protein